MSSFFLNSSILCLNTFQSIAALRGTYQNERFETVHQALPKSAGGDKLTIATESIHDVVGFDDKGQC